ncbi:hypothetical protein POL68_18485 [Stigmatella sp. ncwal1]|uniref:Uncharacterized protein n=1 Tax=Stigmatella ashevillensis TaxID=2995309 RepID=A0ABT5D9V8_9BACT|nr:hypothetical protein [Stigmatella ashevillena]MDC0710472.1 hypothetical protein [Stigmatella ashevillena]
MSSLRSRLFSALAVVSAVLSTACGGPLESPESVDAPAQAEVAQRKDAALAEDLNTTPTSWWWAYGQTTAQVADLISTTGSRIVSLEVEQASPLRFTVAMVKNSGTHAKSWWWVASATGSELSTALSTNNARLVNVAPYVVNGQTLFAAVMIRNTGSDAKGWWWYYNATTSQISTYLTQNKARLVDLRSYATSAGTRYAAVMVSNTGTDARGWWWYLGVSGSQVSSLLSENGAFLTNIEPSDSTGTRFNVVMEQRSGFGWWWYYGVSSSTLSAVLSATGSRLMDVKTYTVDGERKFAAILVEN